MTTTMRYASFGSISSGTMRTEDLLEAFATELEYQVQRNTEHFCRSDDDRKERLRLLALVHEARDYNPDSADNDHDPEDTLSDLFDALETFAPPYAYFGAHGGDGSDYGFWLSSDAIDCSFDGLRVEDTSEVPDDYCGEVLHTSDHGNLTLYTAQNGELTEVWALV